MRFGTRLKTARETAGLSLRGLADRVGCSHVFIKDLETGDRFPGSLDLVRKLARACGESPQTFTDALEFDRGKHWLSKHPEHLKPSQLRRIEEILFSEEIEEPVAA